MTQRKTTFPPVRTLFVYALSLEHLQESTTIAVLLKTLREQCPGTAVASVQTLFLQEEQKRSPTHPKEKPVQSAHASLALSAAPKEKEEEKEVGTREPSSELLRSQALQDSGGATFLTFPCKTLRI